MPPITTGVIPMRISWHFSINKKNPSLLRKGVILLIQKCQEIRVGIAPVVVGGVEGIGIAVFGDQLQDSSVFDFLVDDGLFEVALIKKPTNVIQLYEILHSLLNMTKDLDKEYIKSFRTSEIKFTSLEDAPITWTLDGENGGKSDVNIIKNNSKAISFMIGPQAESNFSNI